MALREVSHRRYTCGGIYRTLKPSATCGVAIALGMIPTYDSGMALIPLLRDKSPMVRATACESAAAIHAKVCEEYVKKLAFSETDLHVKQIAKKAYDQLKDRVA